MYHPSRGGVRGGRDQFNWDDVKVDKHRENYLGHSIKAPVGRWQRGKDLHWYVKNEKGGLSKEDAAKAEIARIKAEEDQAMREALGLAPARDTRTQGSRLDKHEVAELLKRGKTAEELPDNYTEAERVQGLGFAPVPGHKKANVGYEKGAQLAGVQPEADLDPNVGHDKPNGLSPLIPENGEDTRKSKEEKSEAKEKRKQEKKAAKLARKEEKKHKKEHLDDGKERHKERRSRSRRGDDSPSHKRHRRRHDSDSE